MARKLGPANFAITEFSEVRIAPSSTVRSPRSPPGRGPARRGRDSLARPSPLRRRPEQSSTPERLAGTYVVTALVLQSMADDAVLNVGAVADGRAGHQDAPFDG